MFYCNECKEKFDKLKIKKVNLEVEYGISHLFQDVHEMEVKVCPICESIDYEELKKCDYCGEYNFEDDLEDTEGLVNGGIGCLCPQCLKDCGIIII